MTFTYLKVKSVKCLCLLPVVLVLLFWSWSCTQRSWSCYVGLGLKNLVLFTSLNPVCIIHHGPDIFDRKSWDTMFADDTQVYGGSCPPTAVDAFMLHVSKCADNIAAWINSNRLQLDPSTR